MSIPTQMQYTPNTVPVGVPACEGRKSITTIIDFSIASTFTLDLSAVVSQQGYIKSVQTLYIDNSANPSPVTIIMGVTLQKIIWPGNTQGYMPVLAHNPPVLQFSCPTANQVTLQILNFFLPPIMWGGAFNFTPGGALTVSDTVLDNLVSGGALPVSTKPFDIVSMNDDGGTITVGGTVQALFPLNAVRKRFIIANPANATEILQFMLGTNTASRIDLNPGMIWDEANFSVYAGPIFIVAATTGHAFTAYEI